MASLTFDSALCEPDNDASHLLLHQLIVANDFNALTSATAERYLHAFCNTNSSHVRRRWIGLAFAGMIGASASVVDHFQQLPHGLQKLGAIVLSGTELEETKIVAGLAMRQALVHDIEYNSFWASDKVRNSAPNFPKNLDARWMVRFQDFLDALHSLALTTSNNDTSIMYPISLISPGELRRGMSDEGLPVAIIQARSLTVLLPDRDLRDIHFLDIPIDHIHSAQSQQSTLHDSQARTSEHEPWETALVLQEKPWSYRLNTSPRQGTEVTFMFEHSADAKEWENCIKEHQQSSSATMGPPPLSVHPHMSSSSPIKCGSTQSAKSNTKHQTTTQVAQPQPGKTKLRSFASSSQSREGREITIQDNTMHSQSKFMGLTQAKRALRRIEANDNTVLPEKRTEEIPSLSQPSNASIGNENAAKYEQTQEPPSAVEKSSEHNPVSEATAIGPVSKPTTSSKGKLPRVSQSAKDKAFRRLPEPADDLDMPTDEISETNPARKNGSSASRKVKAGLQQEPKNSKVAGHSMKSCTKDTRSRTKRKADDNDEFIPDEVVPKKTTNATRKSGRFAATGKNKRWKRTHKEYYEAATAMSDEAQATTKEKEIDPIIRKPTKLVSKAQKPRHAHSNASEGLTSSIRSSKASLIKGLVDSQKPTKPSSATFKKPLRPLQSVQQPSTPTKASMRPAEPSTCTQTPVDVRLRSTDRLLSVFLSSPPLHHTADKRNVWTPHISAQVEILSSNSKPVPAPPNAESTAISGHADREDVDMERLKADVQTAKSDPFRYSRASQKISSFTRRLTGEGTGDSLTKSIEVTGSGSSELEMMEIQATNQPLLEVMPWARKDCEEVLNPKPVQISLVQTTTSPKLRSQQSMGLNQTLKQLNHAGQSSPSKALGASERKAVLLVQDIDIRPAETIQRNIDRTSTSASVPCHARCRMAEIIAKHLEQDLQNTTNESNKATPQQSFEDKQVTQAATDKQGADLEIDDDETLINHDQYGNYATELIATPVHFPSSPPRRGSPSSHSSTSAEDSEQPPTDPPLPNSDAEELEWEASLNPHQRALHDLLIRTSKRVLRHVVDNETAVTDIAEIFERDGEHVLRSMLQRQDGAYEHVFHDMDVKGKSFQLELQDVAKHLAKQRRRIRAMV